MHGFRPVLVIFAGPSNVFPGKYSVKADVQLWRGQVCITTVKMVDLMDTIGPDISETSCVEQFAALCSRFASRMADEELFERITRKALHSWRDIEAEFPAPTRVD